MPALQDEYQRYSDFNWGNPFYSHLRQNPVISPNDTAEERKEKYAKIQNNYDTLKEVQNNKIEEILDDLELFNGKISLNDILNQEIPIINALRNAKILRTQKGMTNSKWGELC